MRVHCIKKRKLYVKTQFGHNLTGYLYVREPVFIFTFGRDMHYHGEDHFNVLKEGFITFYLDLFPSFEFGKYHCLLCPGHS